MGRILLFVRVSTLGQQLESQEDTLKRAALADGHSEKDIIVIGQKESAIKLSEEEREGLNQLKLIIDTQEIDCIYISELSRLSRQPKDLYTVRELLIRKKIQLKCLHPQFNLLTEDRTKYDATANIIFSLFGALAEQEMLEKKERFARGKKRKAAESKYNGGNVPYGYTIDKTKDNLIVVDKTQGEIVRLIYDLYENGMSQPKIAKELHQTGRANIKISLINKILLNESYTGKIIKTKNASYERSYPPIITHEQYVKCRKIANANSTTYSKTKNVYYAEHLVRCKTCGAFWSATGSKASYHCSSAYKSNSLWNYEYHRKEKCDNKISLSINILDSILWYVAIEKEAKYLEHAAGENVNNYINEINLIKEKLRNIEPRILELNDKKNRLREMYIDGLSKVLYDKKNNEIQIQTNQIREEENRYNSELKRLEETVKFLKSKKEFQPLPKDIIKEILNGNIEFLKDTYPFYHSKLKLKISKITDDKTRYEIIHRHLKTIEVHSTVIKYPFKIGVKDVKCKRIIVHTNTYPYGNYKLFDTQHKFEFYSIPNGGHGALILNTSPEEYDEFDYTAMFYDYECNSYRPFDEISNMIYLERYHDIPKKNRRNDAKEKRLQEIGNKLSVKRICSKYNLTYSYVYNRLHSGNVPCTMIGGVLYVEPNIAEENFGNIR